MEEHEMNSTPRRRFDQQFKEDAVRLATEGTRPLAQVARDCAQSAAAVAGPIE